MARYFGSVPRFDNTVRKSKVRTLVSVTLRFCFSRNRCALHRFLFFLRNPTHWLETQRERVCKRESCRIVAIGEVVLELEHKFNVASHTFVATWAADRNKKNTSYLRGSVYPQWLSQIWAKFHTAKVLYPRTRTELCRAVLYRAVPCLALLRHAMPCSWHTVWVVSELGHPVDFVVNSAVRFTSLNTSPTTVQCCTVSVYVRHCAGFRTEWFCECLPSSPPDPLSIPLKPCAHSLSLPPFLHPLPVPSLSLSLSALSLHAHDVHWTAWYSRRHFQTFQGGRRGNRGMFGTITAPNKWCVGVHGALLYGLW